METATMMPFSAASLGSQGQLQALFRRDEMIEIHRILARSISTQLTSRLNFFFGVG
jgi:hypothetical protein